MKILCTGAMGYIGSILVPRLLEEGHQVWALDNFMYNQTPLLECCNNKNLTIVRGDVTDFNFMKKLYKEENFEVIIPLACLTGAPLCNKDPERATAVIYSAARWMVDTVDKNTKIIYPNTNSGYGIGKEGECTEKSPLNPISSYGRLKCDVEDILLKRGNSISLRLATVFGVSPRMRLDLLVNDFVYRAVNDGFLVLFEPYFRRNFVHVRDVANAFIHCLNNWDEMKDNVYNVGQTSANVSKIRLAKIIKKIIPELYITCSAIKSDPDKRDYIVSNEKLEKTGWKAKYTLEDGIQELIKAYKIIKRNQYSNV